MKTAQEWAQEFPELYQSEIVEMIQNRIETNELREQAGLPTRMTVERYVERMSDHKIAPKPIHEASRMRRINEKLEASRRVLRNAQQGQF